MWKLQNDRIQFNLLYLQTKIVPNTGHPVYHLRSTCTSLFFPCNLIGVSFHGLDAIDSYIKLVEKLPILSYIYYPIYTCCVNPIPIIRNLEEIGTTEKLSASGLSGRMEVYQLGEIRPGFETRNALIFFFVVINCLLYKLLQTLCSKIYCQYWKSTVHITKTIDFQY